MIRAAIVFVSAALADVAWASWSMAAGDRRALSAGAWGAAICLLAAVAIRALVSSAWYVAPEAAGAAIGTWATVKWTPKR